MKNLVNQSLTRIEPHVIGGKEESYSTYPSFDFSSFRIPALRNLRSASSSKCGCSLKFLVGQVMGQ